MKTTTYTLRKSQIPASLLAAFPEYCGRKFRAQIATSVTFFDVHASGGTINKYRLVRLADGCSAGLETGSPWSSPTEGVAVVIPAGFVVVEHTRFCGQDLGLRFHVHPEDVAHVIAQGETAGSFGVRWQQWNPRSQLLTKERVFSTREKRDAYVEKLTEKHTFHKVMALLDEVQP